MAITKQICILDIRESVGGFVNLRCCFWIAVTNGYPNSGLTSAYPNITTDTNTAGILTAIQAGTIIEEVYTFQFPTNWITLDLSTVEALLLAYFRARQAVHAGTVGALPDPGALFAFMYDSAAGWSAVAE
jgi:hypothetical protein